LIWDYLCFRPGRITDINFQSILSQKEDQILSLYGFNG